MNKRGTGNILLRSHKPIQPANPQHYEGRRAGDSKARRGHGDGSRETPLGEPATETPAAANPPLGDARGLAARQGLKPLPPRAAAHAGAARPHGGRTGPTHLRLARVAGSAALGSARGLAVRPRSNHLPEGAAQGEAAHADPICNERTKASAAGQDLLNVRDSFRQRGDGGASRLSCRPTLCPRQPPGAPSMRRRAPAAGGRRGERRARPRAAPRGARGPRGSWWRGGAEQGLRHPRWPWASPGERGGDVPEALGGTPEDDTLSASRAPQPRAELRDSGHPSANAVFLVTDSARVFVSSPMHPPPECPPSHLAESEYCSPES